MKQPYQPAQNGEQDMRGGFCGYIVAGLTIFGLLLIGWAIIKLVAWFIWQSGGLLS